MQFYLFHIFLNIQITQEKSRSSAGFSTTSALGEISKAPVTAIQTHTKKGKGCNEITIY